VLLGPNDVDVFAIIDYLAEERHVLQREYGDVFLCNIISQHELCLQIKAALTKDGADIGTVL
jgi:hypothetical protein